MPGEPVELAQLRNVHKRYGKVLALDGIDLDVQGGQVLALLGANGAGKSTAIALLLGLLAPEKGEARLFGASPHALAARRRIGVMLQSAGIPDNSKVGELLELTRSYYPRPRSVADCVALAGLDGLLDRRYGRLSGGQQRRVQFALAICGDPQLLFLDEPTTGLDLEARQMLWQAIRALVARGAAVLLTTHYLEEAEALADRVVVLNRGRVAAAGTMHEIRAHVSQRRIRCLSALDPSRIAAWPHVRSARATGGAAKGSSTVEAAMAAMPSVPPMTTGNRGHGRSHMAGELAGIEIVTDAAESVVRRLLAEDAALSDLEIQRAGLADAFIELTRNDAMPEAA